MVVFAIPLRAKETTKDWDKCVSRFERTLNSIFNQTDKGFKCIVACNDVPCLSKCYDDRLEFIKLDMPVPREWVEMARDKFWKLTEIAVRIRQILDEQPKPSEGIYVMPVDADDLLNRNISAYCSKHRDSNGFISSKGYVWTEGSGYLKKYRDIHTYCGSCNIIKMYPDDLPEIIPAPIEKCHDRDTAAVLNDRYPIRYDHHLVVSKYNELGRPFDVLPFPSTIYVLGTGENISGIYQREKGVQDSKRFHPVAFIRKLNVFQYKIINRRIKTEFGF